MLREPSVRSFATAYISVALNSDQPQNRSTFLVQLFSNLLFHILSAEMIDDLREFLPRTLNGCPWWGSVSKIRLPIIQRTKSALKLALKCLVNALNQIL